MKRKFAPYVLCAAFVVGSSLLVQNQSKVDVLDAFSTANMVDTARNLYGSVKGKVVAQAEPLPAQPYPFVDRERVFVKTISDAGVISMQEVTDGSAAKYFSEHADMLVEGDHDAIVERFDGKNTDKRIVFNRQAENFPINLLTMLASVVKHGVIDNASPYEQSLDTLRHRALSMTCGSISVFAQKLLENINVKSRVVTTLTMEEWNSYDNGHTFLEVYLPKDKKWVAMDLDMKVFFATPQADKASALDMIKAGADGISFAEFMHASNLDYSTFKNYQTIVEFGALNKKAWYGRVLQQFAIYDAATAKYVFATDDAAVAKRITSYSGDYTTMPVAQFVSHFYGG
ncbi:transglutaminase domain-containing protein [Pseudomonas sichuanensis]|uniref:Transglutaminase domain-containing protein n=1 Tax=Pseudomonas sichuanensis TaxID=2213015 RepID=A0ABV0DL96_9PSED